MLSRRQWLSLAGAAAVAGCAPISNRLRERAPEEAFGLPERSSEPGLRLFNRAGFGPRPGDLASYAAIGHEQTVKRLLKAEEEEPLSLNMQIMRLDVYRMDAVELRDFQEPEVIRQLQTAAVLRAVYGANPLKERMVDFWSNHFNVYGRKGLAAFRKGRDEVDVIRKHTLGSFPDMLRASAMSPAMLGYLDNRVNVRGIPNENYARELMELHTLGVDGGYTQKDIQEVARCFTGWTVEDRFLRPRGRFRFAPERHDSGEKIVLGHRIPAGGGMNDAEKVLKILSEHPSTAQFLARKLCQYFMGEAGSKVQPSVAKAYRDSRGDIRKMLEPILLSDEILSSPPLIKRPFDLLVSSLRVTDGSTDAGRPLLRHLEQMGQAPYLWPMPDGYPDRTSAWTGSMLPRWNYLFSLGNGEIGGTALDFPIREPEAVFTATLARKPDNDDRPLLQAMSRQTPQLAAGFAMCSPEFQWR